MDKLKETFGIREKFSIENAQHLCDEVEHIEEIALCDKAKHQKPKVLEASLLSIRILTEVLIWMDHNQEEWFERVMERDVINTLERIVTNALMPSAIKLQSLQSITLMLQNLSRTSSIYYVCSNNHINRMVAVEFDMHDDEFVSLYVSFLKTLALRCTPETVQFFFDLQGNAFPLWDRAVRLLGSGDAMVRTAAKQIIVTIAQLQDAAVSAFVQRAIADVFLSVMHAVDAQLMNLAANIPSHASLECFVRSVGTNAASATAGKVGAYSALSSPSPQQQQHQQQPTVQIHALTLQLEDIEDELLYLNDVCRTPVANAGNQAAAVAQRIFLDRFQRTIVQETRDASAAAAYSSPTVSPSPPAEKMYHAAASTAFPSSASDIPASVVLAFFLYWIQINTDLQVCAALMRFFLHPLETAPAASSSSSAAAPNISTSIAALVLQSPRVDLHEAVTAAFEHVLKQSAVISSKALGDASSETQASLLHFPTSLSHFYYAVTPYQQTGQVLVGGPNSTLLPSREKFVQKAWGGGDENARSSSAAAAVAAYLGGTPSAPQETFSVLIPHLFQALHTQLRFFHVTRLSCFASTLSLLVKLLPTAAHADGACGCAKTLETAFVEVMKLIQRVLLDCVKQYASVIQKIVRAQRDADGTVPLSHITFEEIQDATDEEAPLPIRDPYAVMFLKLREAAQWLDVNAPDRIALLSAAHTKKDLYLFFSAYPPLDEEACDLMLNVWPPLRVLQHYHNQPQPFPDALANIYRNVQLSVTRAFPLPQRSPVTPSECELNPYVMFLLAKHFFESRMSANDGSRHHVSNTSNNSLGRVDILRQTLRRLSPQLGPPNYFTLSPSTAILSARCELVSEWHEDISEASFAALGAALCLVLPTASTGEGGRELLLLGVDDIAPAPIRVQGSYGAECKRRVLLSLDLSFVGVSLHPRYSFKVVISYQMAGHSMGMHVVMCDDATAKAVVLEVEKAANECRARGASFCFGIMNYRSALLD